ncbi:MAG: hypothetical protein IKV21_01195 [Clostridia bacterium]|nr:hypothetical protein [Clostridia bacterium]
MEENKKWVACWSAAPAKGGIHIGPLIHLNNGLFRSTARTVLRPTLKGEKIRLTFSNRYSKKPLTISACSVATVTDKEKLTTDKPVPVTFGGKTEVTIPAGEDLTSDAVVFSTEALKEIAVNIYVKSAVMRTKGLYGSDTHLCFGDKTKSESFTSMWHLILKTSIATLQTNPFLTRVDTLANEDCYAIMVAGDSTVANEVPYLLAERLQKMGRTNVAVIQQAIAGNRIGVDGKGIIGNLYGERLLGRLDKDIVKCPGVKKVIFKEGINDIIHPVSLLTKGKPVTAEEIIGLTKTAIKKFKDMGWEVYVSRKTPLKGFGKLFLFIDDFRWTRETQDIIDALDKWIEETDEHDGQILTDYLQDKNDREKLRDELTKDHIHYNIEGQKLFVDAIPEEYL